MVQQAYLQSQVQVSEGCHGDKNGRFEIEISNEKVSSNSKRESDKRAAPICRVFEKSTRVTRQQIR